MTPKSLLRHPEARSSFDEMVEGTDFLRIIPDNGPVNQNPNGVKKLMFCTGKVYYDILKAIKEKGLESQIALTRVEQVRKFHFGGKWKY